MIDRVDLTAARRQSPLAIVFLGLRILRSIGIAQLAILVLFIVRAPLAGPLALLPTLAILSFGAFSALAWWRYTFQLIDGELIVTKGVLRSDRLIVPVERIQSISIEQQLLHRATGLVKVEIDTAGSSEAEFTIDAIGRPVAEELQRQSVTATPAPRPADGTLPPPVLDDRAVFTHDSRRLLLIALTTPPLAGLIVLGPLFAFGGEISDQLTNQVPDVETWSFRWWWVPVGMVAFAALSMVLNIVRVILQDWDLTLRASATSLRRTSGLLSRTSKASSMSRIQVVSSAQNPAERRAGIHGVKLATIGQGTMSLPGCDGDQFATVATLAGTTPLAQRSMTRRVHPAAVWLTFRNTTVVCLVALGLLVVPLGWWALLTLVPIPFASVSKWLDVRNFRWSLDDELANTSRIISSATEQALLHKANTVHVTQSIFERRRGLGSVQLTTAAGAIWIGMIPIDEARAVRDTILFAVATDRRPWM